MGQTAGTIRTFRDLKVWQDGMDLVVEVYRLSQGFPASETYGLTLQMRRAAVSIPSNIAEGRNRGHIKEYLHHLAMAQASLAELETQLEIAGRLEYVSDQIVSYALERAASIRMQLYALRNALACKDGGK